ncbi:MAG: class I SAM-dependent methyltransferase [Clostridia bacterium]
MIGADMSDSMLNEAMGKAKREQANILYLQQDMREFELIRNR